MTSAGPTYAPLAGVRVVEFAGMGPGPYGGMLLADQGADVIRVDRLPAGAGDRDSVLNRGKRSVAIDLRHPRALSVVRPLLESADALIDPFRPGVMERLGLAPEACLAWNPAIVYARMTGWGQAGPYARAAGHDLDYIAATGLLHAVGEAGGPPQIPLNIGGDFGGGGVFLALGILAGVIQARSTGAGTLVDAAMVDGAASLLAGTHTMLNGGRWKDERGTNLLDGGAPFYAVYETLDGGYLAVAPIEPMFYREFVRLAQIDVDPATQLDRSTWPAVRAAIAERIVARTRDDWMTIFSGTDACVAPVESLGSADGNAQVSARKTILRDERGLQPGIAPRLTGAGRPPVLGTSPLGGEHTEQILRDIGLEPDEFIDSGVVGASVDASSVTVTA